MLKPFKGGQHRVTCGATSAGIRRDPVDALEGCLKGFTSSPDDSHWHIVVPGMPLEENFDRARSPA